MVTVGRPVNKGDAVTVDCAVDCCEKTSRRGHLVSLKQFLQIGTEGKGEGEPETPVVRELGSVPPPPRRATAGSGPRPVPGQSAVCMSAAGPEPSEGLRSWP